MHWSLISASWVAYARYMTYMSCLTVVSCSSSFFFFFFQQSLSWAEVVISCIGHWLVCVRCGLCQVRDPPVCCICQGQAAWLWVPHRQPAHGAASWGNHAAGHRHFPELWWVSFVQLVVGGRKVDVHLTVVYKMSDKSLWVALNILNWL